ncbi:MAG TPA: hypothetical protein VJU15_01390 [Gemmatimonadales bacterium]|nr:hypothetical protein [Gemmatimonadales bacterium]
MELIRHEVRPVEGDMVRLEGEVLFADGSREVVWFGTEAKRAENLNLSGDPWVIALAPLAVTLGEPLKVPLPVDPELLEGLRRVGRAWRVWDKTLFPLELDVLAARETTGPRARTGSLFSGGADSWYTVLKNQAEADREWVPRLDALMLVWGADINLTRPDAFQSLRERLSRVAAELKCELVVMTTNLRQTRWSMTDWTRHSHGCFFIALAHASGEFGRLLIPSSVTYTNGRGWGSHFATDPLLSSRGTRIVYDAAELGRIEKLELVTRSELALENLRVCWRSGTEQNCGRCLKCFRTMIALELYGGLARCPTFPTRRLDVEAVAHLRCGAANEYRMVRNMAEAALARGRTDVSRALYRAHDRSARLDIMEAILRRLDRLGVRGATRLLRWLETGSIRN